MTLIKKIWCRLTGKVVYNPSKEMIQFLTEWLEWAKTARKGDSPYSNSHSKFDSHWGLCANIREWGRDRSLYLELRELLMCTYNDNYNYPFSGESSYMVEQANGTMHLNQERLQWVKKVLRGYEENK